MKERTRRDKEFWFIDISAFRSIANASPMLKTLSLDVDDDIFLFMFIENDSARIWEMYKLLPEKDLIIKDFGKWTREIGLKLTNLEKWHRRGDLSVSTLIFIYTLLMENFSINNSSQICYSKRFFYLIT